jgi:TolB-like protein/class 3 adenylate cyclase
MAADVAGYSRLMHNAEEATYAKLTALLTSAVGPAIAEHRGRIVKNTGDGFLAEFPSAVEAVRAAMQFQTRIKELTTGDVEDGRIAFRVGINIGDVIVEPHDIFGDDVNIAARLESIAEPGGICISSSAYDHVRTKVSIKFVDLGEQNLKNILRPVRAYAVAREEFSPTTHVERAKPNTFSAPRLSIVVLPFANHGGEPQQGYFVDGVTDSLTTDLSRISGLSVIARGTAFTYRGKSFDVKQIGRELNVRYLLEGSVQRDDNRMRVNVRLIDTDTGDHLWAERFDKPVGDLFDMQDEIVARLANQLQSELVSAEARRAERLPHHDSMDLVFQGRAILFRGLSPDMLAKARGFFDRALDLDSDNVDALIGVAIVDQIVGSGGMSDDPRPFMAAAETKLSKALALAPNHPRARWGMGLVLCATNRAARGIEELERALALDPNLTIAHAYMGLAQTFIGRAEETEAHVLEAFRLSPRDSAAYLWCFNIGFAKACLGRYGEALPWLRKSLDANRNNPWAHFHMAACLAHLGRLDEARREVEAGLTVDPKFTMKRFRAGPESDHTVYMVQRERIAEGMRKAGVPRG